MGPKSAGNSREQGTRGPKAAGNSREQGTFAVNVFPNLILIQKQRKTDLKALLEQNFCFIIHGATCWSWKDVPRVVKQLK